MFFLYFKHISFNSLHSKVKFSPRASLFFVEVFNSVMLSANFAYFSLNKENLKLVALTSFCSSLTFFFKNSF